MGPALVYMIPQNTGDPLFADEGSRNCDTGAANLICDASEQTGHAMFAPGQCDGVIDS
jgi:hypothetical protein